MNCRIILSVSVMLLILHAAHAQPTAYSDALYLKSKYSAVDKAIMLDSNARKVLTYYYSQSGPVTVPLLNTNPFFNGLFKKQGGQEALFSAAQTNTSLSSIGGLNVTNIADGIAKFLVERAKEELSIAFFEGLKNDMNDSAFLPFRTLFPQTLATLNLIDTRIYQFSSYLTELRDAFIIDLKDFGYNVPAVLDLPQFKGYFSSRPQLKTLLSLAGQLEAVYFTGGQVKHVGKIISDLSPNLFFPLSDKNAADSVINGSLKLLQWISASLRSGDTSRYWVTADSANLILKNDTAFRLYLGLLYTQADTMYLGLGKGLSLKNVLDTFEKRPSKAISAISQTFANFINLLVSFDSYWNYKKQPGNKDTSTVYYSLLFSRTIDIVKSGINLVNAFDTSYVPQFASYLPAMGDLSTVYFDVHQQKFSLASLSMVNFFNDMKITPLNSAFVRKLSTYGAFIAEVAQAKSSDDVESIIQNTVLPVGSASIKKNSRFNIALNAFIGGFYGREYLPDNAVKPWAPTTGLTAPIGIAISKPLIFYKENSQKKAVNLGAVSLYASIIDVGAFASYRLKDTTTEQLPKVTLQNIFAPGLGLVWGLPKWPISIGYMYQWGPALRQITDSTATVQSGKMNHRWYFFIAVDIPLLNIFNKP